MFLTILLIIPSRLVKAILKPYRSIKVVGYSNNRVFKCPVLLNTGQVWYLDFSVVVLLTRDLFYLCKPNDACVTLQQTQF